MDEHITPATFVGGTVNLPGDKSISHRFAMIAAIAQGDSRIRNFSTGADCHSTLGCVRALGVDVEGSGTADEVPGRTPEAEFNVTPFGPDSETLRVWL